MVYVNAQGCSARLQWIEWCWGLFNQGRMVVELRERKWAVRFSDDESQRGIGAIGVLFGRVT